MKEEKHVFIGSDARKRLFNGVRLLSGAVACTLGPKGRNVIIQKNNGAQITKDGVTVAKNVIVDDEIGSIGAGIIREVAMKVAKNVGDGTTTATVIANAIINYCEQFKEERESEFRKHVNLIDLKRGIEKAMHDIIVELKKVSSEIIDTETIKAIATISSNNDPEIGTLIANAYSLIGYDGFIKIQESKTTSSHFEKVEGITIPRGLISGSFAQDRESMSTSFLDGCYIAIFDQRLNKADHVITMLNSYAAIPSRQRPGSTINVKPGLLIMVNDIEGEALSIVMKNARAHNIAVIRNMSIGDRLNDIMGDISAITGATIISSSAENAIKPNQFQVSHFGFCEKANITSVESALLDFATSRESEIAGRIKRIEEMIKDADNLPPGEVKKLRTRLAMLKSNAAIIYIGANSNAEMSEKMDRVEDAVYASKAAIDYGYIPGGGVALVKISDQLIKKIDSPSTDFENGYVSVLSACLEPFKTIARNAGFSESEIADKLIEIQTFQHPDAGFNMNTPKNKQRIINMVEHGIVDPAQVTIMSVETACSVASTLLLTETVLLTDSQFMMMSK